MQRRCHYPVERCEGSRSSARCLSRPGLKRHRARPQGKALEIFPTRRTPTPPIVVIESANSLNNSLLTEKKHDTRPPKFAEYLLYFFLSKSERVYLIGDLNEEYTQVLAKFGNKKAKYWFYKQV